MGDGFRIFGGKRFGANLAENEDDEGQYAGRNGNAGVAGQPKPNQGSNRRGRNIDDVVANQDDANQTVGMGRAGPECAVPNDCRFWPGVSGDNGWRS
jgi:hypothetical protein